MDKVTELKNALLNHESVKGMVDAIVDDNNISSMDIANILNEYTVVYENITKIRKKLSNLYEGYNIIIDKYNKDSEQIKNNLDELETNKEKIFNSVKVETNLKDINNKKQEIQIKISQQISIYQNLVNNLTQIKILKDQIKKSFAALDNAMNELNIKKEEHVNDQNTYLNELVINIKNIVLELEIQIKDYEDRFVNLNENNINHDSVITSNLKLLEQAKLDKDKYEQQYISALSDNSESVDSLKQQLEEAKNNYIQLEHDYNNSLSKSIEISKQIATSTSEISAVIQNFNQHFTNMGLLIDKIEISELKNQLDHFQIQDDDEKN
jgi:chromosome segregation ATPase